MTFGIYIPEKTISSRPPVIWYLSGLTCTHENAMVKSGVQRWASEKGIAVVFPDTSPRGKDVPDDPNFDLGQGAGFYVDSTKDPWKKNFQMWSYILKELPELIFSNFSNHKYNNGLPFTGSKHFGTLFVIGRNLVPNPAASKIAFINL